jgi:hypothetical protein
MYFRTVYLSLVALLGVSAPLLGQRPIVGFGIGGGVILGTQLLDYGVSVPVDGQELTFTRELNQNEIGILDAHVEVYPIPHVALRGHGMWGSGDLRVQTVGDATDAVTTAPGRVHISGLDAGISFWPWTPATVGFAPFVTLGVGRVTYDFDAADDGEFFRATGSRRETAFLFGVGADLSVWRSVTLRFEAVNHRLPSPLNAGDFQPGLVPQSALDQHISNVRLVLDAHIYLPISMNGGS